MRVLLLGYYTYDNSNKLLTMSLNGAEYYYNKCQRNVIGLFNSAG